MDNTHNYPCLSSNPACAMRCVRCDARSEGALCELCEQEQDARAMRLDPATLASQAAPRPLSGIAADLWSMFATTPGQHWLDVP